MPIKQIFKNLYSSLWCLRQAYKLNRIRRANGDEERTIFILPSGLKMNLRLKDHIAQRLLLQKQFESEVSTAMFAIVRPGMTVLDVGANIGVHTLYLSKLVGKSGRVLAFEPNPTAYQELQKNIELNHLMNVTVFEIALCERDGQSLFRFPEDGLEAMGGFLNTSRYNTAYEANVKTARIDSILSCLGIPKVDFLKIDVEGAELTVLQGAGFLLEGHLRPAILYESVGINSSPYQYTPDDLHHFLKKRGYVIENLNGSDHLALPYESEEF